MLFKFSSSTLIHKNNSSQGMIKKIFEMIWQKKLTQTGKFLLQEILYTDALIVLISGGGVYASGVFGLILRNSSNGYCGKSSSFCRVIGGYYNDKYSSKKIILICIGALILCVIFSSLIAQTKTEFFICVMVISIFLGTIQSASRVMMSLLLNSDNSGKGFGLYAFSGRITSFLGPLLVGTMTFMFSQRIGLLSCTLLFILGFLLMLRVKEVEQS